MVTLLVALFVGIILFSYVSEFINTIALRKKAGKEGKQSPADRANLPPYPMNTDAAENAAVGAVDKCCEFAAFCEKYVIPTGSAVPEPFTCCIASSPSGISFGFTWNTNDPALDTHMENQGYSVHGGGFSFSGGIVRFEGMITNDDNAFSYLTGTSESVLTKTFESLAGNNYASLGLAPRRTNCRCTRFGDQMEFVVTVQSA